MTSESDGGRNSFSSLFVYETAEELSEVLSLDMERRLAKAAAGRAQEDEGDAGPSGPAELLRQPLVWIDLEMTGLDVEKDSVLQIAVVLTDGRLERVVEGLEIAISHPEAVLAGMNEWCVKHHGDSGLTQAVRDSAVSVEEAEEAVLAFVREHVPEPFVGQLAGNSVHVDLAFLRRCMPRLVRHLHYRIVDVSTVGELARRWCPREFGKGPKKINAHTAMSDIKESIEQLRYYKKAIFQRKK